MRDGVLDASQEKYLDLAVSKCLYSLSFFGSVIEVLDNYDSVFLRSFAKLKQKATRMSI